MKPQNKRYTLYNFSDEIQNRKRLCFYNSERVGFEKWVKKIQDESLNLNSKNVFITFINRAFSKNNFIYPV
ncbi:hypothetical protein EG344_15090 [Chryseobacterium sp. G0162]|nr:hypothetical protein EG344_15090 [Chryseobacterium sp. G0162]